jgi:hypothetical protein
MLKEIFTLESQLLSDGARDEALTSLRDRLTRLSRKASAPEDTPERSQARRVLRLITAGASERIPDQQYLGLLQQFRLEGR